MLLQWHWTNELDKYFSGLRRMFVAETSRHWSCSEMHSQVSSQSLHQKLCLHTAGNSLHLNNTHRDFGQKDNLTWKDTSGDAELFVQEARGSRITILPSCKWKTWIFSGNALLEDSQPTLVPLESPHIHLLPAEKSNISLGWKETAQAVPQLLWAQGEPSCLFPSSCREGSTGADVGVFQFRSVIS